MTCETYLLFVAGKRQTSIAFFQGTATLYNLFSKNKEGSQVGYFCKIKDDRLTYTLS